MGCSFFLALLAATAKVGGVKTHITAGLPAGCNALLNPAAVSSPCAAACLLGLYPTNAAAASRAQPSTARAEQDSD
jgi:hypothetical protein